MEITSDDYYKQISNLNLSFETKLSDLTKCYSSLIDVAQVCNLIEIDSIEDFFSYFTEKISSPLSKIANTIRNLEENIMNQHSKSNFSSSPQKILEKPLKIPCILAESDAIQRIENPNRSIFRITKLNKMRDKKGCLKYLYKRIRNSFNSYISFKINRILKLHNIKLLPHSLKLVNQEQTRPFKTIFESSVGEILMKIKNTNLYGLIDTILGLKIVKLQTTLHAPIKILYTEYSKTYQYEKDLKLIEAQVGTLNIKILLSDIQKHLALVNY